MTSRAKYQLASMSLAFLDIPIPSEQFHGFFSFIDAMITFIQDTYSAVEGGIVQLQIGLNAVSSQPITVQVNTEDDSAVGMFCFDPPHNSSY